MDDLGPRIRRLRFSRQIRVKDLAEQAGISDQSLLAIENGRVDNPGFKTVARIAQGLDVSLDYLYRDIPGFSPQEWERLASHAPLLRQLHEVLSVLVPKLP
ncbi:MAG: helix-turn-helix domain-containing protein [Candidatus Latescibacteria bacterium]|nr:helix-turn-helix domain-containing protein [Candidatus Latescibacterota bacterium]